MRVRLKFAVLIGVACMAMAQAKAQQVTVTGTVLDENKLVMPGASVLNKNTGKRNYADAGGFYKIDAHQGDSIIFTFVGYITQTIAVPQSSGTYTKNILLDKQQRFLPSLEVKSQYTPYQLDSIDRRAQFQPWLDAKDIPLAGNATPEGFGISVSPITRFSRKEKDKRKFQKIYVQNEMEKYIDSRYTPLLVSHVTGMKGDSLLLFMQKFRPQYNVLRQQPSEELIYWIADNYHGWIKK
ncbi:CarboxypepD_reg-like domain-containing protein [Chitinophaga costaii]|uniref:CarboxypepD_reg-like domain-containing protein n=1 Tax=Chitinophaga costaii TaxID=1335309 RepID=A0A1C3ZDG2_9BACT|nr:carboxypeptidase-like regulatory domain-containing protein [Chitinophaga costaii]PUZ30328.1 hypothetical protein DCM91_02300 [Chitinophaga costaii]SCB80394.1 CarboxypepD_reg-like domain-containing protein [Chitinophaga costaii]